MEGSYALNHFLRPIHDVTIAINGGVHLDLLKRIVRDTVEARVDSKETLFQGWVCLSLYYFSITYTFSAVSSIVFPMFKAFIEPDLEAAKIRINSTYNPMKNLLEPTYLIL